MVARQHAEAAGVDRQRLVQAELRRKIGDGGAAEHVRVAIGPGRLGPEVGLHLMPRLVDADVQAALGRDGLQPLGRGLGEERHRVVADGAPQGRVDVPEQARDTRLPAPPEIARELVEPLGEDLVSRIGHGVSLRRAPFPDAEPTVKGEAVPPAERPTPDRRALDLTPTAPLRSFSAMKITVQGPTDLVLSDVNAAGLEIDVTGEGEEEGFGALQMFAASLALCTGAVLHSYSHVIDVPLDPLRIRLRWQYVERPYRVGRIEVDIDWPGVPSDRIEPVRRAAAACTIHHTLQKPPEIITRVRAE